MALFKPKRRLALCVTSYCIVVASLFLLSVKSTDRTVTDEEAYGIDSATNEKIRIFYNLYTAGPDDAERVRGIVNEQFALIKPSLHDPNVSVSSIGYDLPLPNVTHSRLHYDQGNEEKSLHALWNYCRENDNAHTLAVYLHSKGSFHKKHVNDKLRRVLTEGALSEECALMPDTCNLCGFRWSPLPHPQVPGNMWLARCDYVAQLITPLALIEGRVGQVHDHCGGSGRYFYEHWVSSHPSLRPCDLYTEKQYITDYFGVPSPGFAKELRPAPRFFHYCEYQHDNCRHPIERYIYDRERRYKKLYNISVLDSSWWGYPWVTRSLTKLGTGNDFCQSWDS